MALSCAERAGEFGMSIADDWRRLGVGSALLEEIERKAAADGIEWLFGDTLRTNAGMIALARAGAFALGRASSRASFESGSGWRSIPTCRAGSGAKWPARNDDRVTGTYAAAEKSKSE